MQGDPFKLDVDMEGSTRWEKQGAGGDDPKFGDGTTLGRRGRKAA